MPINWTLITEDDEYILSYLDNDQTIHYHMLEDIDEIVWMKISLSGNFCCVYDEDVVSFYKFNEVLNEIEELGFFDVNIDDETELFLEFFTNIDNEYVITNADGDNIVVYIANNLMAVNTLYLDEEIVVDKIEFFAELILLIVFHSGDQEIVFDKDSILYNDQNEYDKLTQLKAELYN